MRTLDLSRWPRRTTWEFFRGFADPTFDLTVRVRAEGVRAAARARGVETFLALLHGLGSAVHAVEPFRMRLRGEDVVVHDQVHPGYVVLAEDGSIRYALAPHAADPGEFARGARAAAVAARQGPLTPHHDRDDVFYVSSMPWLDLVGVRHARPAGPDVGIPRFTWGRLDEQERIALCVSVHHALIDGSHVGRLVEAMEQALADLSA